VEMGHAIYELRLAAQDIVQCLKIVKHLQKNLAVNIASDN